MSEKKLGPGSFGVALVKLREKEAQQAAQWRRCLDLFQQAERCPENPQQQASLLDDAESEEYDLTGDCEAIAPLLEELESLGVPIPEPVAVLGGLPVRMTEARRAIVPFSVMHRGMLVLSTVHLGTDSYRATVGWGNDPADAFLISMATASTRHDAEREATEAAVTVLEALRGDGRWLRAHV